MQKDILAYLSDINGYNDNEVNTQTEITAESIKAAFDKAEYDIYAHVGDLQENGDSELADAILTAINVYSTKSYHDGLRAGIRLVIDAYK